jgi:hypothetical protein
MKRLAARDFEDILQVGLSQAKKATVSHHPVQCAGPVFDGLFPEPHNSSILRLLFICAHWHGLAKLGMHTDQTLEIFDSATVEIGKELRNFSNKTCPAFDTKELKREAEARKRRQSKKKSNTRPIAAVQQPLPTGPPHAQSERLSKTFNLHTYKFHALGDYPASIRMYGTTDSYSTERVSYQIMDYGSTSVIFLVERTRAPHAKISIHPHRSQEIREAVGTD